MRTLFFLEHAPNRVTFVLEEGTKMAQVQATMVNGKRKKKSKLNEYENRTEEKGKTELN
jgi:hypothetical protein